MRVAEATAAYKEGDEAGEALGPTDSRDGAEADLRLAEFGGLRGDDDVVATKQEAVKVTALDFGHRPVIRHAVFGLPDGVLERGVGAITIAEFLVAAAERELCLRPCAVGQQEGLILGVPSDKDYTGGNTGGKAAHFAYSSELGIASGLAFITL